MDPTYADVARRWVLGADGIPRHEPDLQTWRRWWGAAHQAQTTVLKRTDISPGVQVVTSFLLDYQGSDPEEFLFFETIVFHEHDADWDLYIERDRDRGAALAVHERLTATLQAQEGAAQR